MHLFKDYMVILIKFLNNHLIQKKLVELMYNLCIGRHFNHESNYECIRKYIHISSLGKMYRSIIHYKLYNMEDIHNTNYRLDILQEDKYNQEELNYSSIKDIFHHNNSNNFYIPHSQAQMYHQYNYNKEVVFLDDCIPNKFNHFNMLHNSNIYSYKEEETFSHQNNLCIQINSNIISILQDKEDIENILQNNHHHIRMWVY